MIINEIKSLSLLKTNYGDHKAEESDCEYFASLNGWKAEIGETSLILVSPEGRTTKYEIHIMESDFITDTWAGELHGGVKFRIVRPNRKMLALLGDTVTFASMYHDGYAVHYNLV